MTVFRAFINRIGEEKKEQYFKMKSFQLAGLTTDSLEHDNTFERSGDDGVIAEDFLSKVYEYEENMKKKTIATKARKAAASFDEAVEKGAFDEFFED